MKLIRTGMVLIILSVFSVTLCNAEDTAEGLVRKIYQDHRPTKGVSILDKKETLSKYFDRDMTNLFLKDYECSRKSGEVCNLDYDPIYNTQELSESDPKLRVKTVSSSKDYDLILATFDNYGPVELTYKVRKTEAGWRVSDIVDSEGSSLKKMLSQPIQ